MNKFKLICGSNKKPKFCDVKSLFGDLRFHNIIFLLYTFLCLCKFFVSFVLLIFAMFWAWIPIYCRWVHFALGMVYHSRFYLLCCMCDDNDICRCRCGSTWQTYVMMQIKIVMFKVSWWLKKKLMSWHLKFHHNETLKKSSFQWVHKLLCHVWNLYHDMN